MSTNPTLFQMAQSTNSLHEYDEFVRKYFPGINERQIRSRFNALSKEEQAAALKLPDGRYYRCNDTI